jgi:kynurenine 3-monooxygenase
MFVARKKIEVALNRLFPNAWMPLYTMMAHTTIPYAEALERFRRRNRLARWFGLDLILLLVAGSMVLGQWMRFDSPGDGQGWLPPLRRPLESLLARLTRPD